MRKSTDEEREAIEHFSEIGQRQSLNFSLEKVSLKDKMKALLSVFLDDSKLDPITKKLVLNVVNNFFQKASDEDIRNAVLKLREEVIPFILDEEACNCMTYKIRGHHHKTDCPMYENPNKQQ